VGVQVKGACEGAETTQQGCGGRSSGGDAGAPAGRQACAGTGACTRTSGVAAAAAGTLLRRLLVLLVDRRLEAKGGGSKRGGRRGTGRGESSPELHDQLRVPFRVLVEEIIPMLLVQK
jgi:hypothetical protein